MANETKQATHTPAPWRVEDLGMGVIGIGYGDPDECFLLAEMISIHGVAEWSAEDTANALLMAAAPDLLEALKAYVANDANQQLDDDDMYANAVAAITKATGAQT